MMSKDSSNAISSGEFQAGQKPSVSLDGQMMLPFGPEVVPVSRSAKPAKDSVKKTNATSGRNSGDSSMNAGLQSSSGSKSHPQKLSALSKRLLSLSRFKTAITPERTSWLNDSLQATDSITGLGGSIEYKQTWRQRVTPSGLRFWAHTASGRRTSDRVFSGWPSPKTPTGGGCLTEKNIKHMHKLEDAVLLAGWPSPDAAAMNASCDIEKHLARLERLKKKHNNGNGAGLSLGAAVQLTGWVSPTARDHSRGTNPPRPTDTGIPLSQQVSGLTGWATPAARDHKSESATDEFNQARLDQARGKPLSWQVAETAKPGGSVLNPAMGRWLMGFREVWDRSSKGWESWALIQRLLSGSSVSQDQIELAVCEATATLS